MKFLILMTCYLLACEGAPIIPQEPIAADTPCLHRRVVVDIESILDGVIESYPRYYPECEDGDVFWKPVQCDYHGDEIACFCVDVTTGLPLNHIRLPIYHKDSLHCGLIDTQSVCAQERNRKPGVSCTADGKFFKAFQILESTYSCVDVISGESVPGTTGRFTDVINLLTEEVCQAYSERWQAYKKSNRGVSNNIELGHSENVTEESCLPGFIFDESACPTTCVPGQDMVLTPPPPCNQPQPTCVCPNGTYKWNNTCIDVEQCAELSSHDEINETSWKEFLQKEMNEVIKEYLRIRSERETLVDATPFESQTQVIPRKTHQNIFEENFYESSEAIEVTTSSGDGKVNDNHQESSTTEESREQEESSNFLINENEEPSNFPVNENDENEEPSNFPINENDENEEPSNLPINENGENDENEESSNFPVNENDEYAEYEEPSNFPMNENDENEESSNFPVNENGENDENEESSNFPVNENDEYAEYEEPSNFPMNENDENEESSNFPVNENGENDENEESSNFPVNENDEYAEYEEPSNFPMNENDEDEESSNFPINENDENEEPSNFPVNESDENEESSNFPINENEEPSNFPVNENDENDEDEESSNFLINENIDAQRYTEDVYRHHEEYTRNRFPSNNLEHSVQVELVDLQHFTVKKSASSS